FLRETREDVDQVRLCVLTGFTAHDPVGRHLDRYAGARPFLLEDLPLNPDMGTTSVKDAERPGPGEPSENLLGRATEGEDHVPGMAPDQAGSPLSETLVEPAVHAAVQSAREEPPQETGSNAVRPEAVDARPGHAKAGDGERRVVAEQQHLMAPAEQ